jgi:hypothetical protein
MSKNPKPPPRGPYRFPVERQPPPKPPAPIPVSKGSDHFAPKEAS